MMNVHSDKNDQNSFEFYQSGGCPNLCITVEDLEQIQSCQRFPNRPLAARSCWLFILKVEYSVLLTELNGPNVVHWIHNIRVDLTGSPAVGAAWEEALSPILGNADSSMLMGRKSVTFLPHTGVVEGQKSTGLALVNLVGF